MHHDPELPWINLFGKVNKQKISFEIQEFNLEFSQTENAPLAKPLRPFDTEMLLNTEYPLHAH